MSSERRSPATRIVPKRKKTSIDNTMALVATELRIDKFLAGEGVHEVRLESYLRDLSVYTEQSRMS